MNTQPPRRRPRAPRPPRNVTTTATATGSALAVALLPLMLGALVARTAGGDPMVSVNALIASGGQRARLSRTQLRTCGGRALATARGAWGRAGRRADGDWCGVAPAGAGSRTGRAVTRKPAPSRSEATRSTGRG
ncbi:hypothetical protein [Streptomyces sp. NPDC094032]|uniref:hypothetical protein n=1 Tax=Streptomyces sp. NPDC094032 TaxID=3155308 RepID=UPI0033328308